MKSKLPKLPRLPNLLERKIYKTGQTRGADDDVIFQNRVNRNSTVLIPFEVFDSIFPNGTDKKQFENGFIVLIDPKRFFSEETLKNELAARQLRIGTNALLFYETRQQWSTYNPLTHKLKPAKNRVSPLGGHFVARVPSTTSADSEKIIFGFNTSGSKGAGIRVYEYADSKTIKDCQHQLEYLFWQCFDAVSVALLVGMSQENIDARISWLTEICTSRELSEKDFLFQQRIVDADGHTVCPLCLEKLGAMGFLSRLVQAEGRNVPDLTVTEINLFHIQELRVGGFNHRPYNLGWGHHHCNVVCKDSGIEETLLWMEKVLKKNESR